MFIVCFQCSLTIVLLESDEGKGGVPLTSRFFQLFCDRVSAPLEAKLSVSRHLLDCIDTLTQRNLLSLLAYSSARTIDRKC